MGNHIDPDRGFFDEDPCKPGEPSEIIAKARKLHRELEELVAELHLVLPSDGLIADRLQTGATGMP